MESARLISLQVLSLLQVIDDLVIIGASLLNLLQAYARDLNKFIAAFLGMMKWALILLGVIVVLLVAVVGVGIYSLFT